MVCPSLALSTVCVCVLNLNIKAGMCRDVKSQKVVLKQCILQTSFLFWWSLLPDVVPRGTKRNLCLRSSKLLAVIVCSWKEWTAPLLTTQECNSVSLALASGCWKAYCKQNSDSCYQKGILCSEEGMLYL